MSFACGENPPQTANSNVNSNTPATPTATARTLKALTAFNVEWASHQIPSEMQAGKPSVVTLTIKNPTSETWPAGTGPVTVNIAYHWMTADGTKPVVFDGVRTPFPHDIAPGESITVTNIGVLAPPNPGAYRLQMTLVQETISWFEWGGAKPLTVPVTVR
jgi:hypothetical protein